MDRTSAWPEKHRSIFDMAPSSIDSPTACSIAWLSTCRRHEGHLSADFRRAADCAIEHLCRGVERRHPDSLFMPIAYLYRHSLELALKHLARLGQVAGVVEMSDVLDESLGGHDLAKVWRHVRAGIEANYPHEDRKVLRNVEALINDFQRLDRSGQNLRYSKDKQRRPTARNYPKSLDLAAFRDAFAGVHNLLEACADSFEHCVETRAEMEGWL